MKRAATVVLIALLTAVIFGINDTSWASQNTQTDTHRQQIAARLATIPIGSPIEVEPTRGKKYRGVLEDVAPGAITVRLATGNYAVPRTVLIDEIKNVKRVRNLESHTARNVAIVAGVTAAVLVGTCAAALSSASADMSQAVPQKVVGGKENGK